MAMAATDERIDFLINANQKELLELAAEINHLPLSSYVLLSSLKQAQLDLEKNEVILLSNSDRDRIMAALDNPPTPNAALQGLFQ